VLREKHLDACPGGLHGLDEDEFVFMGDDHTLGFPSTLRHPETPGRAVTTELLPEKHSEYNIHQTSIIPDLQDS
jgi:hypothetical protein